nr:hypothetical protein [Burkholderia anthina]
MEATDALPREIDETPDAAAFNPPDSALSALDRAPAPNAVLPIPDAVEKSPSALAFSAVAAAEAPSDEALVPVASA